MTHTPFGTLDERTFSFPDRAVPARRAGAQQLVGGRLRAAGRAGRPPRRITHEMDAWSRNFVMLRTDMTGRPINRLEGEYAEHFPDDDSYHITAPAVGQRESSPITVGISKTAIMEQGGKRIVMNGDAYVHRQPDANNDLLDAQPAADHPAGRGRGLYRPAGRSAERPFAHERHRHALQQQDPPVAGLSIDRRGNRRRRRQAAAPHRDSSPNNTDQKKP